MIGHVNAPAYPPHGLCHGGLITPGLGRHGRCAEGLRRTLTVAAWGRFASGGLAPDLYNSGDPMCGDERCGGLPCGGCRSEPLLALLACIERVALLNGALGARGHHGGQPVAVA